MGGDRMILSSFSLVQLVHSLLNILPKIWTPPPPPRRTRGSRGPKYIKELPRDLVEKIVDIAADMLDDEVGGTDGQLACDFVCEVFDIPLPQSMIEYQAELQATEDEYR